MKNSALRICLFFEKIKTGLIITILFITAFNTYQISLITGTAGSVVSENSSTTGNAESGCAPPGNAVHGGSTSIDVIPKGIPQIYGTELGVSFDDISPASPQKADLTIKKIRCTGSKN